jgi:hypothetical protein
LVVYQKSKWGNTRLEIRRLMGSSTVDEFFEKVEKKSEYGKKLVSWHGELVPLLLSM